MDVLNQPADALESQRRWPGPGQLVELTGNGQDGPARPGPRATAPHRGSRNSRLLRYSAVSVVATVISQATLVATYGLGLLSARDAAITATLAGAVPSYWLNRRWAWGRSDRSRAGREVVPYFATAAVSLVASTWATDAASSWAHRLDAGRLVRTAVVAVCYFGSFAALWLAKFAVNELIFRPARARSGATRVGAGRSVAEAD